MLLVTLRDALSYIVTECAPRSRRLHAAAEFVSKFARNAADTCCARGHSDS